MPGLIVRKDNGELRWYPFFEQGDRHSFYPDKDYEQKDTGWRVGRGFNFEKFLPGYWMPTEVPSHRRHIGGGSSLVVLDGDDLKHYPFREYEFKGGGDKVGNGFNESWDYYVAEWTGNGTSDLLVRDDDGDLRLFPWDGEEFRDLGRKEEVGQGFDKEKYPELYPGYWEGGEYPCLLVREDDGDLWIYPFDGSTFKDQGKPRRVGRGFDDDFVHLFVGEWTQNGTPDIIAHRDNDKLILYPYDRYEGEYTFHDGPYESVGVGFHEDWIYIPGHWRTPGKPELMLCDDDHKMRFYPFDGSKFIDLDKDDKYVGKGFKFTHFFEFYGDYKTD